MTTESVRSGVRALRERSRSAPVDPSEDGTVRNLVRELAGRVSELVGPDHSGTGPVLDCTELGMRCLLVPMTPRPHELLSPREIEIARMVGLGYTNRAIAAVLEISLYTVSAHMRRIFTKLGVGNRASMVAALSQNSELIPEGGRASPKPLTVTGASRLR
ncbi:MAG TPA: helix-turn-helix transcriptional regulator [Amycolatopsis sp.]|uniref:helix-turn-helix transcriptional regulator n=1 Tax=Amycolatopsis sp. TaxID=37632 RepID=UPI002B464EF2|nr:helix-turn-helix transcriptional regulator [Amycolatopsis sp.]HKS49315.1 helix-turn-helix transcriptional regulator [Amycolatopsis sp.]